MTLPSLSSSSSLNWELGFCTAASGPNSATAAAALLLDRRDPPSMDSDFFRRVFLGMTSEPPPPSDESFAWFRLDCLGLAVALSAERRREGFFGDVSVELLLSVDRRLDDLGPSPCSFSWDFFALCSLFESIKTKSFNHIRIYYIYIYI